MIMEYLKQIAAAFGYISAIVTAAVLLIKPFRDKVLGLRNIADGLKCTLRSEMLRTYYQHHEHDALRQYEMENFHKVYQAYKALGGNSFIDDIYKEVRTWEVLD